MNESVLHHVWQHRLFKQFSLKTCDGEAVEVIDAGRWNRDAGPDFFNAKVKIAGTIWAGNVEIHVESSDWYKHNHHLNPAYDNVVLHVVFVNNCDVFTSGGVRIPQILLNFTGEAQSKIESFLSDGDSLMRCKQNLSGIDSIFWNDWKQALILERLDKKCRDVYNQEEGFLDSDELFYRLIVRSFGTHLNADAFLALSKNLPLKIIRKHQNQPLVLLALFAGVAGFLRNKADDFNEEVIREFLFLRKKYGLIEMGQERWRELRTRPQNFPANRLVQLVVVMLNYSLLKRIVFENTDLQQIKTNLLCIGKKGDDEITTLIKIQLHPFTRDFVDHLLINAVIPFVYSQEKMNAGSDVFEKIEVWLSEIKPEKNVLIRAWMQFDVELKNAFDTQSLIQLTQFYCRERKCLRCRIGHQVLKKIIEVPGVLPDKQQ